MKSRYHPNYPLWGYLSRSVTGAPVPVLPGNLGNGIQTIRQGAFTLLPSLETAHLLGFRIVFAYLRYSITIGEKVNGFPQKKLEYSVALQLM